MDLARKRCDGLLKESRGHTTGYTFHHNTKMLTTYFLNSDYIQIRSPVYISHSAGRYAIKRFRKAQCPIIERLTNSLMMNGRNNGKKLMAVRIVAHCFEIVRVSITPLYPFPTSPKTRNNLEISINPLPLSPEIQPNLTSNRN